mgnify:FL=1|tara:strand:+ start:1409 stop:2740 length:1332 start_codon:yes stop_codon:yes gene_type:complete
MKYFSIFILFLFPSFLFGQDTSLSLDECLQMALSNNENLKNSILEENVSKMTSREYLSVGFPQIQFETGLKYNFEIQKSLIDISKFMPGVPEGTEQEVSFGQKYDGIMDLGINQMIFNGSYFVGLAASKALIELSEKQTVRAKVDIIESVNKAYYVVLNTKERLSLVNSNLDRIESLLNDTEILYENGFVEKLDVDRIKVSFNNLNAEKIKAERLYDLSLSVLKFQIGFPVNEKLSVKGSIEDVILSVNEYDIQSFDYSDRIEHSILNTNKRLKSYDLKNNRSQFLPQIYANLSYGYNTSSSEYDLFFNSNRWKNYGTVGLQVIVPIFDGFNKRSKINRSKIVVQQVENQIKFLERSIDLQINQNYIELKNAIESLNVSKDNLVLANEVYNVSEKKYKEGVGSNLEVLDSNNALKTAQTNYYNAYYQAIISKINLEKTLGILN